MNFRSADALKLVILMMVAALTGLACGTSSAPTSAPVFQMESPTALPATPNSDANIRPLQTAVAGVPTVTTVPTPTVTSTPEQTLPLTPSTASQPKPPITPELSKAPFKASTPTDQVQDTSSGSYADVKWVSISGSPGSYGFSVRVRSPDTGCDRYADWWEVLTTEGQLIYRRVLFHSHVGEQPFTRSGGPINAQPDETIIVRAHFNATGYGGIALRGNVADGFTETELAPSFAVGVEEHQPLPQSCAF